MNKFIIDISNVEYVHIWPKEVLKDNKIRTKIDVHYGFDDLKGFITNEDFTIEKGCKLELTGWEIPYFKSLLTVEDDIKEDQTEIKFTVYQEWEVPFEGDILCYKIDDDKREYMKVEESIGHTIKVKRGIRDVSPVFISRGSQLYNCGNPELKKSDLPVSYPRITHDKDVVEY